MAKNEPNNPEDVKNIPENEQTESVKEAPAPEMTAEEAATLTHEGEAALREMEKQLEPSIPFDISGEHVPDLDDIIVPSDKISETEQEVKPPAALEKQEAEKSDKAPNKQGRRGKTVQEEAQEAKTEDARKETEEQRSEAEPKKERKPRMAKQTPALEKGPGEKGSSGPGT